MVKARGPEVESMADGLPRGVIVLQGHYRLVCVAASLTSCAVATGWLLLSFGLSEVTMVVGSAATVRITAARSSFSIVFDLRSA
jgi:hypothetical protein